MENGDSKDNCIFVKKVAKQTVFTAKKIDGRSKVERYWKRYQNCLLYSKTDKKGNKDFLGKKCIQGASNNGKKKA